MEYTNQLSGSFGTDILSQLKRLSAVESRKDIRPLSAVTYPGTHCPLFGAAMTVRQIKDTVLLVIGTEECTYYTKSLSLCYGQFGGLSGRCLSFVMNHHDVTFGCKARLEKAAKELMEEYSPKAVFMVTTCVPEMTGEDVDSIADGLSTDWGIPFLTVHTDHFRCDGHLSGIQNVWAACANLMEACPSENGVNLLGKKAGDSELVQLLRQSGAEVFLTLPSDCSLEMLKTAPRARMNIVCSKQALLLAKAMEQRFNIPWISFYDRCLPEEIEEGYRLLYSVLELELPKDIGIKRALLEEKIKMEQPQLAGGSFIYGSAGVEPFVLSAFFARLGMHPVLIQAKEFGEAELHDKTLILNCGDDPYISQSANLVSMQQIYSILKPDLYLGPAERDILMKHGIVGIGLPKAGEYIGFELAMHMLDSFSAGMKRSRELEVVK